MIALDELIRSEPGRTVGIIRTLCAYLVLAKEIIKDAPQDEEVINFFLEQIEAAGLDTEEISLLNCWCSALVKDGEGHLRNLTSLFKIAKLDENGEVEYVE